MYWFKIKACFFSFRHNYCKRNMLFVFLKQTSRKITYISKFYYKIIAKYITSPKKLLCFLLQPKEISVRWRKVIKAITHLISYFRCAHILETFQLRMNLALALLTFIALDSKFAAKILVSVTMSKRSLIFLV